jgi:peptidoglycan L-alanyl-D-glutamate endopeptidase CwlK
VNAHIELIKLVIAYTLVGAFIFTVVVTCASLVGLIKFANPKQQSKLFYALIIELVTVSVGSFADILNFNPAGIANKIEAPLRAEVVEARKGTDELQKGVLEGLQPEARALAKELIVEAHANGVELRIVSGYRSIDEQLRLYARGRTDPGPIVTMTPVSIHNTGLAFDVAPVVDGSVAYNSPEFAKIGELGGQLGLIWGGDRDVPHFETRSAAAKQKELRSLLFREVPPLRPITADDKP